MTINWPSDTITVIDAIRDAIGREITIYSTISGMTCPASGCGLDPVTNLSIDSFCVTCSGFYWINTVSGLAVTAHVRLRNVDIPVWTVGGFIVDGDAQVQVKYTSTVMDAIDNVDHFLVDGKEFLKKKLSLRGVPTVNRIVVTLEEKEG
ncbi:hypothetical protein KA005_43755 [bacterium]|nr:hypothetical protein [bacterium]